MPDSHFLKHPVQNNDLLQLNFFQDSLIDLNLSITF